MNKTQLRLLLDKEGIKVSNTRIGEVALSLGFGNHVDYTYSGQESQQILTAIRQDYKAKVRDLKQPQHLDAQQKTGDRHSQSLPAGPIEHINHQRQEADFAVAHHTSLAQQTAIQGAQSLAESAHLSAQQIGYQQALIIASYPGLVAQYTNQYLNQFKTLEARAQTGFTTTVDFQKWTEELTQLAFPAFATTAGSLQGAESA